jgi:hypothetical protein
VGISNRFAALGNLDESLDVDITWKNITESFRTSVKGNLRYHKLKCSKLIDEPKQATLQWLQNPSQISGDNLQNLRRETNRTFRKRKENF